MQKNRSVLDGKFYHFKAATRIYTFCWTFSCVRKPGLCGYMFKSRSPSQTISYRVSGSSNEKSRTLYVHCRFLLCPKDDRLSLCRIGCSGVSKKIKSEQYVTMVLHAGPLTINEKTQG